MAGGSRTSDRGDAGRQYARAGRSRQHTLQIRLTVVEGCSGDAGNTRCAAPHKRSDAPELPQQIRDLAPPADSDDAAPAVTVIY